MGRDSLTEKGVMVRNDLLKEIPIISLFTVRGSSLCLTIVHVFSFQMKDHGDLQTLAISGRPWQCKAN